MTPSDEQGARKIRPVWRAGISFLFANDFKEGSESLVAWSARTETWLVRSIVIARSAATKQSSIAPLFLWIASAGFAASQ
jgi:hypothetical protein